MLPEIHSRIMRVQIECQDFRKIFKTYDTPETFFYCDPPYLPDTRKNGGYRYEMNLEDHKELVQILLKVKGKVLLSGYRHEVYTPLEEAGWRRIDFPTVCFAAGRTRGTAILGKGSAMEKQPRIESVWVSPNAQEENHLIPLELITSAGGSFAL
jgi:DNA adenine methylase